MAIELAPLPYGLSDLEPYMSKQTLETHYGKHHLGYVEKVNKIIEGTQYDKMDLAEIVVKSYKKDKKLYNNAAQAWNHDFFWHCLAPEKNQLGDPEPSPYLKVHIELGFGSFGEFKKQFAQRAVEHFGSGWVWLVRNKKSEALSIVSMNNAGTPFVGDQIPLMVCDVWEHAYYIDHRNERAKYIESFWNLVNWDFVEMNYEQVKVHKGGSKAKNIHHTLWN